MATAVFELGWVSRTPVQLAAPRSLHSLNGLNARRRDTFVTWSIRISHLPGKLTLDRLARSLFLRHPSVNTLEFSEETEAILAITRGYERGGAQIVASAARFQGVPTLRTIQPRTESGRVPSFSQAEHVSSMIEGIPVPNEVIGTLDNSPNETTDTAIWDHDPVSEDGSDLYSESDLSDEYPFESELGPDEQMEALDREYDPGESDQSGLVIPAGPGEAAAVRGSHASEVSGLAPSENDAARLPEQVQ